MKNFKAKLRPHHPLFFEKKMAIGVSLSSTCWMRTPNKQKKQATAQMGVGQH